MMRAEDDEQLRTLYVGCYRRLVAVTAVVAGTTEDAEECVQAAFVKLIDHWPRVSAYDDPEAWVRQVAWREALNLRRRLRGAARVRSRLRPPETTPDSTDDILTIRSAIEQLSIPQRKILVLVDILGMTIAAASEELDIPVGTAKSRLSRAREALRIKIGARTQWTT